MIQAAAVFLSFNQGTAAIISTGRPKRPFFQSWKDHVDDLDCSLACGMCPGISL